MAPISSGYHWRNKTSGFNIITQVYIVDGAEKVNKWMGALRIYGGLASLNIL